MLIQAYNANSILTVKNSNRDLLVWKGDILQKETHIIHKQSIKHKRTTMTFSLHLKSIQYSYSDVCGQIVTLDLYSECMFTTPLTVDMIDDCSIQPMVVRGPESSLIT